DLHPLAHIFTRTRKAEVGWRPQRTPHTVRVDWCDAEHNAYAAITRLTRFRAQQQAKHAGAVTFATIMPQRRAASCLPATAQAFLEEVDRTLSQAEQDEFDDLDLAGEEGPDGLLPATAAAQAHPSEARLLAEVRTACRALRDRDTKYERFLAC